MKITITWAKRQDINKLHALDKIAHKELKWWGIEKKQSFMNSLKESKYNIAVAKVDGEIVGYIQGAYNIRSFDKNKTYYIENILVLREYRRYGIAKSLIRKFTSAWKRKEDHFVLLTHDEDVRIFKKLGFKKSVMNLMNMNFKDPIRR